LGKAFWASDSSKAFWRCKLEGSTKSRSNDSQLTDAGADQKIGGGSSDGAATDDDGAGGEQPLLAFGTDPGEKASGANIFAGANFPRAMQPRRAQEAPT